jgi:hypothetical protein
MSALARWDAFLAQIEGRARQVRDEAEASARTFIASVAGGGDFQPLSHQLMAVRSRLQELESMIADTWHAKVDDAISAEGHGSHVRDAAFAKGEALRHALDDAREELEPRIFAELVRQRYARGLGESVVATAGHAVAQEQAVGEWRAMRVAERALHAMRPPRTLAIVQAYEAAQIAYWRKYLAVRAQFEPILARDPSLEIRSRMDPWYRSSAEYEEAWVAAGRPRMPV